MQQNIARTELLFDAIFCLVRGVRFVQYCLTRRQLIRGDLWSFLDTKKL